MNLNQYASQAKLQIFDALKAKQRPPVGTFDETLFKELLVRTSLQVGATTYQPDSITLEFIASRPGDAALLFPVRLDAPEPIVFMPVPEWVIEDIYAGGIDGMFCFRSEAEEKLSRFQSQVFSEANAQYFERRLAKRRDET